MAEWLQRRNSVLVLSAVAPGTLDWGGAEADFSSILSRRGTLNRPARNGLKWIRGTQAASATKTRLSRSPSYLQRSASAWSMVPVDIPQGSSLHSVTSGGEQFTRNGPRFNTNVFLQGCAASWNRFGCGDVSRIDGNIRTSVCSLCRTTGPCPWCVTCSAEVSAKAKVGMGTLRTSRTTSDC